MSPNSPLISRPTTGPRTHYRTCPFCEATCGLAVDVEDDRVVRVRGDKDDPSWATFIMIRIAFASRWSVVMASSLKRPGTKRSRPSRKALSGFSPSTAASPSLSCWATRSPII